jgi:hypothetical protein
MKHPRYIGPGPVLLVVGTVSGSNYIFHNLFPSEFISIFQAHTVAHTLVC